MYAARDQADLRKVSQDQAFALRGGAYLGHPYLNGDHLVTFSIRDLIAMSFTCFWIAGGGPFNFRPSFHHSDYPQYACRNGTVPLWHANIASEPFHIELFGAIRESLGYFQLHSSVVELGIAMDDEKATPQEASELRLELLRRLVQSGEYEVPADHIAARLIDLSTNLRRD
jgi:hypothetical protein